MSCARAGLAASATAPKIAHPSLMEASLNRVPANHRAAARLSSRNGTRDPKEGLCLLGRPAEQARHFLFEAVEHGFRLAALRVGGTRGRILRRGRRWRFAVGKLLRGGGLRLQLR